MGQIDETAGAAAGGLTRRSLVIGLPALLAACQTVGLPVVNPAAAMYGAIDTEPHYIPAIDLTQLNPAYYRTTVPVPSHIPNDPGRIVVDPHNFYLYFVLPDSLAFRYGVGVGRAGFEWGGNAVIRRKAEWPTWTPTQAMMERDPLARPWAGGMPGGITNPLGARALYLYQGDRDTLYRLHGTPETWSIGQAMSSGCIRLLNHDVIHLHQVAPIGTRVTVLT